MPRHFRHLEPGAACCGRRRFLRRSVASVAALLIAPATVARARPGRPPDGTLRVGFVVEGGDHAAAAVQGVQLGVEEAERALALLGGRFEAYSERAAGPVEARAAADRLSADHGVFAVIGGFQCDATRALARWADQRGVLFFNVACDDDALRGGHCHRTTFHVEASTAMRRDALALWAREADAAVTATGAARAQVWHPGLRRFGAGQLNDRFVVRFGAPLQPSGWAGWMAVKLAWEAAARARSTDAEALVAHLESGRTRFDGHKGMPLSFRRWDHQLRQPLYLVATASAASGDVPALLGEVPRARRGEERDWDEILDRLGGEQPAGHACERARPQVG